MDIIKDIGMGLKNVDEIEKDIREIMRIYI
jgi:hypothetical protein